MPRATWFVVAAALVATACGAAKTFESGVAAMAGKGGTVARADAFPAVRLLARFITDAPVPRWETQFPDDGAEFMAFVGNDRLLVGSIEVEAYLGNPRYRRLIMYDVNSGARIWEVERPESPHLSYQLVSTSPVVITAQRGRTAHVRAFDTDSGTSLWQHDASDALGLAAHDSLALVYVLTHGGNTRTLDAREFTSGRIRWIRRVPSVPGDSLSWMDVAGTRVFVVGPRLHAFDAATGVPAWPVDNAPAALDSAALLTHGDDAILWNARATQLHDRSGRMRWKRDATAGGQKLVSVAGDRVVRVEVPTSAGDTAAPPDVIEALDASSGATQWKATAAGTVVSALVNTGNTIVYATADSLASLDLATGARRYTVAFPRTFRLGSPTRAVGLALADQMMLEGERLYIARELAGAIAYSWSTGQRIWYAADFQPVTAVPPDYYSAQYRFKGLGAALVTAGAQPPPGGNRSAMRLFTAPNPAGPVGVAAQSWDKWQTEKSRRDRHRLSAGRLYNPHLRYANEGANLANAMFDLAAAISVALEASAKRGLVERYMLGVQTATWAHNRSFQNGYYVRPMSQGFGLGITIVDLATGKRADFPFGPYVELQEQVGFDGGAIAIDPQRRHVFSIGVGDDTLKYKPIVKWQWRLPAPSLMAFDIARLRFVDIPPVDSVRDRRADSLVAASVAAARAEEQRTGAHGWRDIFEAIAANDTIGIGRFIASGTNVNTARQVGATPLGAAILGNHPATVRFLMRHGAHVNIKNDYGRSPWDIADPETVRRFRGPGFNAAANEEIRRMLRAAGAKAGKDLP